MRFQDFKKYILEESRRSKQKVPKSTDLAFEIGLQVLGARIRRGLTQNELAKKIGTKQPSIARLESGSTLPSLFFLSKISKALRVNLVAPRFDWQDGVGTNVVESTLPKEYLPQSSGFALKGVWGYGFKQTQMI